MPSFSGKTFASFYKNLLGMDQSSNTGVTVVAKSVQDGAGNNTAIKLSDDQLAIVPNQNDRVNTFQVQNTGGSNILAVDTTNSKVLTGASQVAANTQYAYFGIVSDASTSWIADTHMAVPFTSAETGSALYLAMGSSTSSSFNDTNPATSLTITNNAQLVVNSYWYVMDDITIDAVKWLHAADAATGDDTAAHLMAYTVDIANGSTGGDLSSGVVVADGATITNAGVEQIYYQSMTIQSANVDAGKVILFTFASDTVNSDFSISANIKYHIR